MPIRTNRGRAAVYRRLWGWPLRSPVHLLAFVLGIALAGVLLAILISEETGQARAESGRPPATAPPPAQTSTAAPGTTAPPSTATTRLSTPLATPTSAPPTPQALRVAEQWASAWVDHPRGITSQQWLAGLAPYTTDEYLPVMSSVDPKNVPASEVTGEASAKSSYTSSAQILVPTDGGELELSVIRTPVGWRVAGYTKAG